MTNRITRTVITLAALSGIAACDNGSTSLSMEGKGFDCEGSSCSAYFIIENRHDTDAKLAYDIQLYRTMDDQGRGVPEEMVGEAAGTISLEPGERMTVTENIAVTDVPNGMSAGYSTLD